MFFSSTKKSHRTWRSQMKSWNALQELILTMCKFPNTFKLHLESPVTNPVHFVSQCHDWS